MPGPLAGRGQSQARPDCQRRRKKVPGKNKTEVRAKLAELHDELNDGVVTNAAYSVAQAIKTGWPTALPGARRRRSAPSGKS